MKQSKLFLWVMVVVGGLLLSTRLASATAITINNAGFENPVLADFASTSNTIPDWTGTDTGLPSNFGVFNPNTTWFTAEAPEGSNIGYIERGAIFQTLTDTLAVGNYTLTVLVGDSKPDFINGFTVELRAGTTILNSASTPVPANDSFSLVTVAYTATAGDSSLGQSLEIRLIDDDPDKVTEPFFDDVKLDFISAPEPSALLLLGFGLVGLGLIRKRHT